MSLLASLAPGEPATQLVVAVLVQTTAVILVAALVARVALRRRAAARHGLWLGALTWMLLSPAVVAVAGRTGFALWVVNLPAAPAGADRAAGRPEPGPSPAIAEAAPGTARDVGDPVGGGAAAKDRLARAGDADIAPSPEAPTLPAPATPPAADPAGHAAPGSGPTAGLIRPGVVLPERLPGR